MIRHIVLEIDHDLNILLQRQGHRPQIHVEQKEDADARECKGGGGHRDHRRGAVGQHIGQSLP